MTKMKFKCTLLTDVILNQKAASEGPNKTLDFIPGSCFLGIAASKLYDVLTGSESWEIFHSGNVIFGDAHPSANGIRGLKTPLAMYAPKLDPDGGELFIYHKTPKDVIAHKSLKQVRKGFNVYENGSFRRIKTSTNYAVKSKYDYVSRRAEDAKMFCYESLAKGLELYFEVVAKDEELLGKVKEALTGRKTVGRSRTAQFGLVNIEPFDYGEVQSAARQGNLVEVYADSRLMFLDEYGLPKFQPTAEELGLKGTVDWSMTQLRTFQYAPWNFKRKGFDADRCGIEKGSVFVVRIDGEVPSDLKSRYVGCYNNEGFGKVIYNPCFLDAGQDGAAIYKDAPCSSHDQDVPVRVKGADTILIKYLRSQREMYKYKGKVYEWVNEWVTEGYPMFRSATFASQWGNIRSISQQSKSFDELKTGVLNYLNKGVASAKWKERGRLNWIKAVLESKELNSLPYKYAQMAMINLATEMPKKN